VYIYRLDKNKGALILRNIYWKNSMHVYDKYKSVSPDRFTDFFLKRKISIFFVSSNNSKIRERLAHNRGSWVKKMNAAHLYEVTGMKAPNLLQNTLIFGKWY